MIDGHTSLASVLSTSVNCHICTEVVCLNYQSRNSKMIRGLLNSSFNNSFTKSYCTTSADPSSSLTLHFLKNSCGLSQETALPICKQIHFKRTKTPHAVLSLLKSYNFSKSHIVKIVTCHPKLLLRNPEKIIKPKLQFLDKIGLSNRSLIQLITCVPTLLSSNLENKLLKNYNILKDILGTNEYVLCSIRSFPALLVSDLDKTLLPKIKILEENGVSTDVVNKLLTMRSKSLMSNRFDELFELVKRARISPKSPMYAHAFGVLGRMTAGKWEMKVENFRRLGWTEEEVMAAFINNPYCMSASEDKVAKNVEFYKEKFGWDSSYLSRNSNILTFSFEKRILTRYRILKMLSSKGLVSAKFGAKQLRLGEREFLIKYVMKHHKEVPALIDNETSCRLKEFGLLIDNM